MEALGLGMQTGEAWEAQGPKSLTAIHWLCGRAVTPGEACQVERLWWPTVRPENSHVDL